MRRKRKVRLLLVALVVLVTGLLELHVQIPEAHAVVGRPLTPVSYAGVARRTTRRAVRAGAATGPVRW